MDKRTESGYDDRAIGRRLRSIRRHAPSAQEPQELLADSALIEKELGWIPRQSDLRKIVTDTWEALA